MFGFLLVELYVIAGLSIVLHRMHARRGLSPLVFYTASLTILLNYASPLGVLLHVTDDLIIPVFASLVVPNVLMAVLIVYIANGTFPARLLIIVVVSFNALFALLAPLIGFHANLADVELLFPDVIDVLFSVDHIADVLASTITFSFDMLFIVIVYQGMRNHLTWLPLWLVPGIALMSAVWMDAVLFRLLSDLGTDRFVELLPGDVLGKTLVALLLAPIYSVYLRQMSINEDAEAGVERPILDVIFGGSGRLEIELLRSQAELHETKANLQQLTEHINEVFWLVSPDWERVDYVSPAFETVFGYSREALYEDTSLVKQAIHPDDRDKSLFINQFDTITESILRICRADGEVRWVRTRVFPIVDADEQVTRLAMISSDITAQKQAEEHEFALETEKQRVQVMRDFIHEAAHDLRSPITGLMLRIDLLNRVETIEQLPKFQADMRRQVDQLAKMIDDLFTLSRIENSETYALETLEINALLQGVHQQLLPVAEEKAQNLLLSLETRASATIMGDKLEFERAIGNLVNNAINYTPADGLIAINTAVIAQQIIIRISDTGIGIHEEDLETIFERFKRARTALDAGINGTGLGLAIVKQIVEKHNGAIRVDSTVGQGTTFIITLPLIDDGGKTD